LISIRSGTCLNGQVDGGRLAERGGWAHPRPDLGLLARREPAPADRPGQASVEHAEALPQRRGIGLNGDHADLCSREHLRDAGPHGSEADDRDLANVHGGDITVAARALGQPAGSSKAIH
jgi:hypothetical protein